VRVVSSDDATLIRQTLAGDRSAFGTLVRKYQDRVYNVVYRLVGHVEDARDITQDAFINAYESLRRFQGDAQFYTWLYRIAINAAISKQRKRRETVSLQQGGAASHALPEPIDESHDHQPGDALERQEMEHRIHTALQNVSDEFRAVLVLRDLDGLKYEEIADALDLPIGTVRSRLHRARLELRAILEKAENEVPRT
jgi:RNA polymerase sigma-70 factor, ECF subfamily